MYRKIPLCVFMFTRTHTLLSTVICAGVWPFYSMYVCSVCVGKREEGKRKRRGGGERGIWPCVFVHGW